MLSVALRTSQRGGKDRVEHSCCSKIGQEKKSKTRGCLGLLPAFASSSSSLQHAKPRSSERGNQVEIGFRRVLRRNASEVPLQLPPETLPVLRWLDHGRGALACNHGDALPDTLHPLDEIVLSQVVDDAHHERPTVTVHAHDDGIVDNVQERQEPGVVHDCVAQEGFVLVVDGDGLTGEDLHQVLVQQDPRLVLDAKHAVRICDDLGVARARVEVGTLHPGRRGPVAAGRAMVVRRIAVCLAHRLERLLRHLLRVNLRLELLAADLRVAISGAALEIVHEVDLATEEEILHHDDVLLPLAVGLGVEADLEHAQDATQHARQLVEDHSGQVVKVARSGLEEHRQLRLADMLDHESPGSAQAIERMKSSSRRMSVTCLSRSRVEHVEPGVCVPSFESAERALSAVDGLLGGGGE
eukprot:scaffold300_cov258-Pinguiococcus_pyrenoidosus.AAC.70